MTAYAQSSKHCNLLLEVTEEGLIVCNTQGHPERAGSRWQWCLRLRHCCCCSQLAQQLQVYALCYQLHKMLLLLQRLHRLAAAGIRTSSC